MKKSAVKITCQGSGSIGLALLHPLQGELKKLDKSSYEKMKAEILEDGFSFPIAVWENPADTHLYILDGHQRFATLKKMAAEGYEVPEVPINMVHAEDLRRAKRKILAAASVYGKMDQSGLTEFLRDVNLNAEDLISSFQFTDLDLQDFTSSYFADKDKMFTDDAGDLGKTDDHSPSEPPWDTSSSESSSTPPLSSDDQVRMVQLFLNGKTQPEFLQKIQYLQERFDCKNLTETVLATVRQAYSRFEQQMEEPSET